MSGEGKKSNSNNNSNPKPESQINEIKWINENSRNIQNHQDRDIQKGFDFESKPIPPTEKPQNPSEGE